MSGEIKFTLPEPFANGLQAFDEGLERAIVISLFTDAKADDDDAIPDESTNRRGWWADSVAPPSNAPAEYPWLTGSKLWLLWREKQTPETTRRAKRYAEKSLQWLIQRGDATSVVVSAYFSKQGLLMLPVTITLANGSIWQREYKGGQ